MTTRFSAMAVQPGCGIAACWKPRSSGLRPVTTQSLIEEAAALWESLSQNHPFIDGNKRTAFAAAYTFLVMNGARLTASAGETEKFLLGLYAAGTFDFERLNRWLRDNVAFDAKGQ